MKKLKKNGIVTELLPWQKECLKLYYRFSNRGTKFLTINAGRRAGKSRLAAELIKLNAASLPDARIVFSAKKIADAKRIMWDELITLCGEDNIVAENKTSNEIKIRNQYGGYATVYFFGWDNINRARGLSIDLFVFDEVAMYNNFFPLLDGAVLPATADRKGRIVFISSPLGLNHFHDMYNRFGEDYTSFHATMYDNPLIDRSEIERLKNSTDPLYFKREYMAEFFKREGLIYHEFDRSKHIFDKQPEHFVKIMVGVDFGYTAASTIIEVGVDFNNHLWVYKENYIFQKTNDYLINVIQTINPQEVYPDIAEPDRIAQFEEAGLNVMRVSKARKPGFDRLNQLFSQGRIHISSECKQLISELENYSWKEDTEEPDKESGFNADGVDALRYVCFNSAVGFVNTGTNVSSKNKISYKYKTII